MSHFSVAVIGNVETQMARFNEQDENYFTYVEKDKEEILKAYEERKDEKRFRDKYPTGTLKDFLLWWGGHVSIYEGETIPFSPYAVFDPKSEELLAVYVYHNELAVYDYYGEGYEAFITKNGETTNKTRIGDLDFDAMLKQHETELGDYYDDIIKICGGIPNIPHTWKSLLEKVDNNEIIIEEARKIYNTQPAIVKFNQKDEGTFRGFDFKLEDFSCTREEYIKKHPHTICYGLVYDGKYYSRGNMGWWGISDDKMSKEEWSEKFWELIKNADPSETITMLDCHI